MKNMQDVLVKVERSIATHPVELKARSGNRLVRCGDITRRYVPYDPASGTTTSKYTIDQF